MWQKGALIALLAGVFFLSRCGERRPREARISKPVVVATLPDLADWVRAVAGDSVAVSALITGAVDPHTFEPGPKDVERLARAALVVRVGLGFDHWLSGLIQSAANPRLRVLDISQGVSVIQDEEAAHSAAAGVHHYGNPHIWLDPEVAKRSVRMLAESLAAIEPELRGYFAQRADEYIARIDRKVAELRTLVAKLTERRFLAMHESWPYFARAFGFEVFAAIEPLPGQEPSAENLLGICRRMKKAGVRVVVAEPQHNLDVARAVARETGSRLLILPSYTGSLPEVPGYLELLEYDVRRLVEALSSDTSGPFKGE